VNEKQNAVVHSLSFDTQFPDMVSEKSNIWSAKVSAIGLQSINGVVYAPLMLCRRQTAYEILKWAAPIVPGVDIDPIIHLHHKHREGAK
jgi:hypothetical protein